MKNKIKVLKKIAQELNSNNISWAVGASALLFSNDIVDEFHDIDIMIDDLNSMKVKTIMDNLGTHIETKENSGFKTKHFMEYIVDDVEIDIIGGFIISKEGIDYNCEFNSNQIDDYYQLDNVNIPLHSVSKWRYYYSLMNRDKKVEIIDSYYKK